MSLFFRLSSVRLSSVTFVRRTLQPVEIFANVSTPFGTLAIRWHPEKILRRSSQGNPCVEGRGLNARGIAIANIALSDLSKAISRKRWKLEGKLVLVTNRKSYMSFHLVAKSVTWMALNGAIARILRHFTEFDSFRGALRKRGWRYTQTFCDKTVAQRM